MRDTIFALATAPGRSAVAVVRVSGPGAGKALRALAGRTGKARTARRAQLRDAGGAPIDEALTLWFPGPASYTGEDVAELHLHGGPSVVSSVIATLVGLGLGLRLAEPGEFTRRAFEAGKLDLAQAEAVADLIDAETDAQARQALAQMEGVLSRRYEGWREGLIAALAHLEAAVDFPDEDLPAEVAERAAPLIEALVADLEHALADARRGERVREGYKIAIVGAPNAGKSRLFNALVGRDAAIVTAHAGTTRDVIESPLVIAGYKVVLADMAGVRPAVDEIEAEGVRRARAWASDADLRLLAVDASADRGAWVEAASAAMLSDLLVLTKTDLTAGCDAAAARAWATPLGVETLGVSAVTGGGLDDLRAWIERRVVADLAGAEFPAATRQRHATLLGHALGALQSARQNLAGRSIANMMASPAKLVAGEPMEPEVELAAEDLRLAARALERITGRIGAEDVLDLIFASFCIGK
jgi:tRNA modification GTPase